MATLASLQLELEQLNTDQSALLLSVLTIVSSTDGAASAAQIAAAAALADKILTAASATTAQTLLAQAQQKLDDANAIADFDLGAGDYVVSASPNSKILGVFDTNNDTDPQARLRDNGAFQRETRSLGAHLGEYVDLAACLADNAGAVDGDTFRDTTDYRFYEIGGTLTTVTETNRMGAKLRPQNMLIETNTSDEVLVIWSLDSGKPTPCVVVKSGGSFLESGYDFTSCDYRDEFLVLGVNNSSSTHGGLRLINLSTGWAGKLTSAVALQTNNFALDRNTVWSQGWDVDFLGGSSIRDIDMFRVAGNSEPSIALITDATAEILSPLPTLTKFTRTFKSEASFYSCKYSARMNMLVAFKANAMQVFTQTYDLSAASSYLMTSSTAPNIIFYSGNSKAEFDDSGTLWLANEDATYRITLAQTLAECTVEKITDTVHTMPYGAGTQVALGFTQNDVGSLVGAEHIQNYDFSTSDLSFWATGVGGYQSPEAFITTAGQLTVEGGLSSYGSWSSPAIDVATISNLSVAVIFAVHSGRCDVRIGTTQGAADLAQHTTGGLSAYLSLDTTNLATVYLSFIQQSGYTSVFDSISLRSGSVNHIASNAAPMLSGTALVSQVAAGSDLAMIELQGGATLSDSGPWHDVGTGDFYILTLINCDGAGFNIAERKSVAASTSDTLFSNSTGAVFFGGQGLGTMPNSGLHLFAVFIRDGYIHLNVDGQLINRFASTLDFASTGGDETFYFCGNSSGSIVPTAGLIAGTNTDWLTADYLRKTWAELQPLLQPQSKCLLPSGLAVNNMDYDPQTGRIALSQDGATGEPTISYWQGSELVEQFIPSAMALASGWANNNIKSIKTAGGNVAGDGSGGSFVRVKSLSAREQILSVNAVKYYDSDDFGSIETLLASATDKVLWFADIYTGYDKKFISEIAYSTKDDIENALYTVRCSIKNDGSGAVLSTNITTEHAESDIALDCFFVLAGDNLIGYQLQLIGQGLASTNIYVNGKMEAV